VRSTEANPLLVAIDYLAMDPLPGVVVLEQDFLDPTAPDAIRSALGAPADVVLSDMAAPTTGHRQTDHLRTIALCEAAADFAVTVLRPGGDFLAKVFQGGAEGQLLAELKRNFTTVHHAKPPASRAASVELYLVAKGFRSGR
jgi:23S rRNA (uridine2552-2'-O)-methyltransferase